MRALVNSSTRMHTSCGCRPSPSVGGNKSRLSAAAPRAVHKNRKVVHCLAEAVADMAPSTRGSGKKQHTSVAPQIAAQHDLALQWPGKLASQRLEPASTGTITSAAEALQMALSSLNDFKTMKSLVAECGAADTVQQHFHELVEAQQRLIACLQQHQKEEIAASSIAAAAEPRPNNGTALPAEHDGLLFSVMKSCNSSNTVMSAAASVVDYPIITEHVADVYESQLGTHPQPLVLNSPASSDDESGTQQLPGVWAGVAAGRGQRRYMEDVSAVNWLHSDQGVLPYAEHSLDSTLVAGVYDGHGGRNTAAYAAAQLPILLQKKLLTSGGHSKGAAAASMDKQHLFSTVFHQLDRSWGEHGNVEQSGSTAVTAFVNKKNLVVANAGDSVAVLACGGSSHRLTRSHNLCCPEELARVTAAGGQIVADRAGKPRLVQSQARCQRYVPPKTLAVSRGFGDFGFKGVGGDLVIPTPHVAELELSPEDELLLLTSDGVTDVMADDEMLEVAISAISKARNNTDNGRELATAAAAAVKDAAVGAGAYDNITALAILLDWSD